MTELRVPKRTQYLRCDD